MPEWGTVQQQPNQSAQSLAGAHFPSDSIFDRIGKRCIKQTRDLLSARVHSLFARVLALAKRFDFLGGTP